MADLNPSTVLRKTESGVEAIKTRDRRLTPKHRMLLIVIDGNKSVTDHTKGSTDPAGVVQALADLVDSGFAEVGKRLPGDSSFGNSSFSNSTIGHSDFATSTMGQSRSASVAPASNFGALPLPSAPAPMAPATPLPVLIRRATKLLEASLGPSSETLCIQLEKCQTIDQFVTTVNQVGKVVAGVRSDRRAAEFINAALAP